MGSKENKILNEYGSALGFGQPSAKRANNITKKRRAKREAAMGAHTSQDINMHKQNHLNTSLVMFYQQNNNEEKGESGAPGSPNHHHISSQVDGSTGGNHGSTVVFNRPHNGQGPELVYNESLNSSNYVESNP